MWGLKINNWYIGLFLPVSFSGMSSFISYSETLNGITLKNFNVTSYSFVFPCFKFL